MIRMRILFNKFFNFILKGKNMRFFRIDLKSNEFVENKNENSCWTNETSIKEILKYYYNDDFTNEKDNLYFQSNKLITIKNWNEAKDKIKKLVPYYFKSSLELAYDIINCK
jgi:hypothetical protein